jgi:hypothetical protein
MLFVKILKMEDKEKMDLARNNWFLVAREIGST